MDFNINEIKASINSLNETMRQQFHQEQLSKVLPVTNPVVEQLKKLVNETQDQNKILLNQVEILKEDNERQKKMLEDSREAEKQAKREAKHSKIFAWISFGISTIIAVAALVVSIIAL